MAGVYRRRCWRDTVLRELLAHGPEDEAGDYLLCYFTGVPHWIGVLEVVSEPFMDRMPISDNEVFCCGMEVELLEAFTSDTSVRVHNLLPRMKATKDLAHPLPRIGCFCGSPAQWDAADSELVVPAIREVWKNPAVRPAYRVRLMRKSRVFNVTNGPP
jgi:hypothetical protein